MSDFRKLGVWQKAHQVMLDTHSLAGNIRSAPYLALKNQVVRAAMSIPANIVEGRAQRTDKEFSRFLGYSIGSASELEYHLIAGRDIGVLPARNTQALITKVIEVRKMLLGLQKALEAEKNRS
ncbi:MAG TPA: four helix bundle protein [Gemmatimonadaceae bacterium]|nr:four helix bundle protein [Gemmatimonadaceae bacterium]